jgi:hypothetical protein
MTEEHAEDRTHYRYSITLRITHPFLDPSEFTSTLGFAPNGTWRVGEPRKTIAGVPLSGIYPHSFWYAELRKGEYKEKSLAQSIDELLDELRPHCDYFGMLNNTGGKVEFFVGWIFYHNSGERFEPALLAKFAGMHIALSLDVYGRS